ncbi:peptide/nickel transport system substrate-binding protein [Constrictibacter sp. MBR-5]|uniref:ABC transporter substrate-binding protein n=1 Tax=Constrictibacter sp. MBR-5 TaxID=3156467 RepID=UPI0033977FFA
MSSFWRPAAVCAVAVTLCAGPAAAQKSGGVFKLALASTPPSGSIHEEATINTIAPFMPVFNNLILYDPHVERNTIESIIPELATAWRWSGDGTKLTFTLREGVKWHDGKPFTARDVKCTWDTIIGQSAEPMRKNPRKPWYDNLKEVTANGDHEVTFHVGRLQPSLLNMLASGGSPVYPCHVSARDMRLHPIGTGPFKFAELRQNEVVRLVKNPDYWKKGLPYLDGIEFNIIRDRSTRVLSLVSDHLQMSSPGDITVPLVKQLAEQAPQVQCHVGSTILNTNMMLNRTRPPFDNAQLRQAVMLTLDRTAFVNILTEGKALKGGSMLAVPAGVWGLPEDVLDQIPGQAGDVEQNREKARAIMRELGYGPENRLKVKLAARNVASFRDPAVILIDHLKEIYIDADLETIEVALWYVRLARRDYTVALNLTGNVIDDPDAVLFENFSCNSERNYTGYCNPELEKKFLAQSMETDFETRRKMVWDIDRQLTAEGARTVLFHNISATCHQPYVRNYTHIANGMYNSWRLEDIWLDR